MKENPEVKCATNVTSTHLPFDLKIQKSDSANSPDGKDIAEIAHVKQYMQVTPKAKRHYYTEALSLPYDFEPFQEKSDITIPKGWVKNIWTEVFFFISKIIFSLVKLQS